MPILPAEPDLFPPDLLDRAAGGPWWALYTLARREKDLMRRLRALGVPFYAPLVKRRNRSSAGRVRTSYVPLFPGYVFLHGEDTERREALATNCVSQCIQVVDGDRLLADLRQIRRLIESNVPLTPEQRLSAGQRVRVRSGSLAGLEGVILKRHGGQRLLVAVEFLQQGASVQLEDFLVEAVD